MSMSFWSFVTNSLLIMLTGAITWVVSSRYQINKDRLERKRILIRKIGEVERQVYRHTQHLMNKQLIDNMVLFDRHVDTISEIDMLPYLIFSEFEETVYDTMLSSIINEVNEVVTNLVKEINSTSNLTDKKQGEINDFMFTWSSKLVRKIKQIDLA